MIISVLYLLVRCLLGCLSVLSRGQVSRNAEPLVLRHENAALRRHVRRVRYEPADGLPGDARDAAASHQRLIAHKRDYPSRRRPGRPSTAAAIRNS